MARGRAGIALAGPLYLLRGEAVQAVVGVGAEVDAALRIHCQPGRNAGWRHAGPGSQANWQLFGAHLFAAGFRIYADQPLGTGLCYQQAAVWQFG